MNLRLPGMGDGPDKPAMLGGESVPDNDHESPSPMSTPGGSPSMDFNAQSIDSGGSMAPNAAAPLIRGLVVLVVLLAVAGGGLYAMRSMGQRGLVEDPDVTIDIKAFTEGDASVVTTDHVELLEDLRGAGEFAQVSLENVQMNPFSMRVPAEAKPVVERPSNRETEEQRLARERAERIAELQRDFARLRLNSVMAGSVPIAQISGTLVRVGDMVSDRFTVSRIEGRSVELRAEGQTFVLVIGE